MGHSELTDLIAVIMIIFMIMPLFLLFYAFVYQNRKKKDILERAQMKAQFDMEIIKTQQEIKEQTLQTVGADLHDNIGQLLSLASLTLKSIPATAQKGDQRIETTIDLLTRSIKEMRLLGKLIQGDQLVSLGLIEAIRQEITWLEKTGTYKICARFPKNELTTDPEKDLVLFRVIQELLQNIVKHAQATKISIILNASPSVMQLTIRDNGIGFEQHQHPQQGMGLANIQKRTALIEAELTITSAHKTGTTISITLPYAQRNN